MTLRVLALFSGIRNVIDDVRNNNVYLKAIKSYLKSHVIKQILMQTRGQLINFI